MTPIDPAFRFVAGNGLSSRLNILRDDSTGRPDLACYLYSSDDIALGTRIAVNGSVPGYAPFHAIVDVPPIGAGCPDTLIVLARQVSTGSLRLRLEPPPEAFSEGRGRLKGVVHLAGWAGELQMGVSFDKHGVAETTEVPHGQYRALLSLEPEGIFESPEVALVVPQGPQDWVVDVSNTGAVLVVATTVDSDEEACSYQRGLRAFVGRGSPLPMKDPRHQALQGAVISFSSSPFLLPIVQPGDYTVIVQEPSSSTPSVHLTVLEGVVSRVPLTIRQ